MKVAADSLAASGHGFATAISDGNPEVENFSSEISLIVVIKFAPGGRVVRGGLRLYDQGSYDLRNGANLANMDWDLRPTPARSDSAVQCERRRLKRRVMDRRVLASMQNSTLK